MQQFRSQFLNDVVAKYTEAFDFIHFNMLDHGSDVSVDYDYTNTIWFLNSETKGEGSLRM